MLLNEIDALKDPTIFMSQFCNCAIYPTTQINGDPNFTPIVCWAIPDRVFKELTVDLFVSISLQPAIHALIAHMNQYDVVLLENTFFKGLKQDYEKSWTDGPIPVLLESYYDPDYSGDDPDEEYREDKPGAHRFQLTCRGDVLKKTDSDAVKEAAK